MGGREKILFVLALALALGFLAYSLLGPGGGAHHGLAEELGRLEVENARLAEENRRLGLEVQALKNRPEYLEKVIRDELGLVRPDELVFRLLPAPDGGASEGPEP